MNSPRSYIRYLVGAIVGAHPSVVSAAPRKTCDQADAGGRANFGSACAARGSRISVVYRDRDLVPRGTPGYVFATC